MDNYRISNVSSAGQSIRDGNVTGRAATCLLGRVTLCLRPEVCRLRKGMGIIMVESKLSKVKVNNELILCEVYDSATKERIKKVFFREGISFFIKFKKKFGLAGLGTVNLAGTDIEDRREAPPECKEGKYIICVNKSQEQLAKTSIKRVVPDHRDRIVFYDEMEKKRGEQSPFWSLIAQIE